MFVLHQAIFASSYKTTSKKSAVKEFFEKKGVFWPCKQENCNKEYSVQKTGTLSHLWNHLKRDHKKLHVEVAKKRTSATKRKNNSDNTIEQSSSSSLNSYFIRPPIDTVIKKNYDRAVLRFIIEDGRSFETTSGSGFINLCSVLTQGQYHPPHPTTLSRNLGDMIDDLYINFQQSIKSQFISKPSITFDHFKADNCDNFLVSTCHFISSSWVLESCCLSVVNLEVINACHKATSTEEILRNVLSKFDLTSDNIFRATTDTTPSMPCTLKLLGIDWLGCCAHKFQLCVKSPQPTNSCYINLQGS